MKPRILAVIPARGGSKGVPGKNIKPLLSKPLIAYSIEAAINSKIPDKVVVTTDSFEIKKISLDFGAEVIDRPRELALDNTPTEPVILHAIKELKKEGYDPDVIILLQPTSPLRNETYIREAFIKFNKNRCDSLLSVCKNHIFLWKQNERTAVPINYDFLKRPRRQEMNQYSENGAIYITKKIVYEKYGNRLGGKIGLYEMPQELSIEIDSIFDFELCETIMIKQKREKLNYIVKEIKMVLTDVDGVLTDGGMYYNNKGEFLKKFNTIDGMGMNLLMKKGFIVGIITKENSEIVVKRAKKIGIKEVYTGVSNKLGVLNKLMKKYNLSYKNIAYIGDDLNDWEVIKMVGLSCCPSNARDEVKKFCVYITKSKGGDGAFRELADFLVYHSNSSNEK